MKRGDSKIVIASVVLRNSVYSENCIGGPKRNIRSPNTIVPTHFPTTEMLPCLLFLQLPFPLGVNVTGIFPTCKVEGIYTSLIINHKLYNY